jgi:hypothetical protein
MHFLFVFLVVLSRQFWSVEFISGLCHCPLFFPMQCRAHFCDNAQTRATNLALVSRLVVSARACRRFAFFHFEFCALCVFVLILFLANCVDRYGIFSLSCARVARVRAAILALFIRIFFSFHFAPAYPQLSINPCTCSLSLHYFYVSQNSLLPCGLAAIVYSNI